MSTIRQRKKHAKKSDRGNEIVQSQKEALNDPVNIINLRNTAGKL